MSNFFNKVAGGINKGVNTVSANSKAVMEKTKVKGVITNLENERRQYIQALGQMVYDLHAQTGQISATDEITGYLTEITKRLEMMQQQNEELARIDAELAAATNTANPAAAPQAQVPVPPAPTPPVAAGTVCTCGQQNPGGAKFCAGCGSPVQ